jgi:hypothetical protein
MTELEFALAYLKAVQKKHHTFFEKNDTNIMKCVSIRGTRIISVHIINKDLPTEIQYDIEEMFWKS